MGCPWLLKDPSSQHPCSPEWRLGQLAAHFHHRRGRTLVPALEQEPERPWERLATKQCLETGQKSGSALERLYCHKKSCVKEAQLFLVPLEAQLYLAPLEVYPSLEAQLFLA